MVYLDYAATTPCDPDVIEAMTTVLKGKYGNPSSIHSYGQNSAHLMFQARKYFAELFGLQPQQALFVPGGTESDNLALWGSLRARPRRNHFVTTAIEHSAVAAPMNALAQNGAKVTFVPVDSKGIVDFKRLYDAITPLTNVVSIIHVNNEMGAIQPLIEIGKIIRDKNPDAWFHTDAVQAFGKVPVPMQEAGIDMVTTSGHKIYGPLGTGLLLTSARVQLQPIIYGSRQEYGLRSGTENYVGIHGMHLAAQKFLGNRAKHWGHFTSLNERFLKGISSLPVEMLSPPGAVPYIVAIGSSKLPGAVAVSKLNEYGVAASSGAACASKAVSPSDVMLALGFKRELAEGVVRFSFGIKTTNQEIDAALDALKRVYGT